MKAIQAAERGGYEALCLVEIPEPQRRSGQALVRVTSAGVTPLDRTVLAGPVCGGLCGGFSGPPDRQPAWPRWLMKSSIAWLTSSACVQMIACGPPAMMVERAVASNAGSLRLVAS
jgi:hypothetical protein